MKVKESEECSRLKETQETGKLRAVCGLEPDSFAIKDIIGIIGKPRMKSEDQMVVSYQCDFPDLGGYTVFLQENGLFERNIQKSLHSAGYYVDHYFQMIQRMQSSLYYLCIFSVCLKLRPEGKMTHQRSLLEAESDQHQLL